MDEYTKTAWAADDVITATKLNHIEDGIEAVTDEVADHEVVFDPVKGFLFQKPNTIAPTIGDVKGCFIASSSQSLNGTDYTAQVGSGLGKIVVGASKSANKNYQLVLGQLSRANADFVQSFPWVSGYVDSNYVLQANAGNASQIIVGACVAEGIQSIVIGDKNVAKKGLACIVGQSCYSAETANVALGEAIIAGYRDQVCIGVSNSNLAEDAFEVGNGTFETSTYEVARSNAFRVTKTGDAIAQTSLGIEDGNGGVVSITAAQLQTLLSNASPTCLVTMTYDSTNNRYVSDKTAAEVYAAYNAAKSVVFKFSDIGYVMWGGRDHAEAFCPNVHMLYRESAAGDISDPKYIIDGYGPNDITLGMVAPTSADYFIMEIS